MPPLSDPPFAQRPSAAPATDVPLAFDCATAIHKGRRDRQEDSLIADFSEGAEMGFAILADGMGGHAAGDIASKLAVTDVFASLKLWADHPDQLEHRSREVLMHAVASANQAIGDYVTEQPYANGMGSTLLVAVIVHGRLYWVSVGDSPLFLFRQGRLHRLNAEHSFAARLDAMVAKGEMSRHAAESHPDRSCVTSVLTGQTVPEVDCRSTPLRLQAGDLVIAASDGLHSVTDRRLTQLLRAEMPDSSSQICRALMATVNALALPEQDNTALCVLRAHDPTAPAPRKRRRLTLLARATGDTPPELRHHIQETSQ